MIWRFSKQNVRMQEPPTDPNSLSGDRIFKLPSGTTSEPGRYLKSLGDPVPGMAGKRSSRGTPVAFATIESMV